MAQDIEPAHTGRWMAVAGVKLKDALLGDPTWIVRLLQVSGAIMVIQVAMTLGIAGTALGTGALLGAVFAILIIWYLYASDPAGPKGQATRRRAVRTAVHRPWPRGVRSRQ